jgi:hypothetical protein
MRGDALGDLGHLGGRVAGAIELTRRHRVDRVKPGKQPDLWQPIYRAKITLSGRAEQSSRFRIRSTSHSIAARSGCTNIPLAAGRAQEDETILVIVFGATNR